MPRRPARSASRRRWGLFVAWAGVAAVLLLAPGRFIPESLPPWAEAAVHVGLFAVGAWTVGRALCLSWPAALVLGVVLAAGTEGVQEALSITRSATLSDAVWNVLGVALGVGVLALQSRLSGPRGDASAP